MAPVESLSSRSPTQSHRSRACSHAARDMGQAAGEGWAPCRHSTSLPGGQCKGHGQRVQLQAGWPLTPPLPAGRAGRMSGLLSPCRLFTERQRLNYRLHSVSCAGTEVHLSMCAFEFYRGNASAVCGAGMPAVVSCVPGPLFATGNAHKKKQRQQQQGQVSPARRGPSPAVATAGRCPAAGLCCPGCTRERVCGFNSRSRRWGR